MQRRLPHSRCNQRSSRRPTSGVRVPQEHKVTPDEDSQPRDWSQLGRRVMAEAWRRLTDERAARRSQTATPAAPARQEGDGR